MPVYTEVVLQLYNFHFFGVDASMQYKTLRAKRHNKLSVTSGGVIAGGGGGNNVVK